VILAQLLAADYLPAVWMPDAQTSALRRQRRTSEIQRMIIGRAVTGLDVREGLHRCSASSRRLTSVGLPLIFLA